jgi:RHS repeat-associated protein
MLASLGWEKSLRRESVCSLTELNKIGITRDCEQYSESDSNGDCICPQSETSPLASSTISYVYDELGRLSQRTVQGAGAETFAYDAIGRLITHANDLGSFTLGYLGQTGQITSRALASSTLATTWSYDALSRPYQVYNTAIQANPLLQQTYTADGLRASLADANYVPVTHPSITTFAYDGFDRLATTTYPNPGSGSTTETFTYDADSNVKTRKTRAGSTITYTYDTLNRLATKSPPSAPVVTYSYDLTGRLTGVSDTSAAIASVAGGSGFSYATSYTYDGLNHPLGVSWTPAPTAALSAGPAASIAFTHTYNAVNQRVGQAVSDNTWINYPTGTAGTTAATCYTSNNLNQYTTIRTTTSAACTGGTTVSPTYDTNANLKTDGAGFTFGYDPENRLASATKTGTTATYDFDGRGRRKQKTVNGTKTVSVTDADNREVLEYDGSTGAVLRWYAYGLGSNDVVGQMNVPANTRVGMIPDIQGSVIGTVDGSTGALTSFAYRPYGAAATAPAQFGYTGQRIDQETGLYYYRARHYSPAWGRFLQSDPLGYAAGPLLYRYVGNDPLNSVDPLGLDTQLSVGVGGTLVLGFGVGFSFSGGIDIPTNPLNIGGYQAFVTLQGNKLLGVGIFGGLGIQGAIGTTPGPLPSWISTSSGWYNEVDIGVGPSAGTISAQGSGLRGDAKSILDVESGSFGLPLRYGFGWGAFFTPSDLQFNRFGAITLATPTFGNQGIPSGSTTPFIPSGGTNFSSPSSFGGANPPADVPASSIDPSGGFSGGFGTGAGNPTGKGK